MHNINDYQSTDFILGQGDWEAEPAYAIDLTNNPKSLLDPNYYIGFFPNYNSFKLNFVIKWNYSKGANLYFVYTSSKSTNGKKFNNINDFLFSDTSFDWAEILRDQSIILKIDYWFNK